MVLGYLPLFQFFAIGGRKWIIRQFIPRMFFALFSSRINFWQTKNSDNLKKNWYRVTCYKYIDLKKTPIHYLYEFVKRKLLWRKYKGRQIKWNCGYLVCYYRYGMENGTISEDYTSILYQVSQNGKRLDESSVQGIAGMTFISEEEQKKALDNKNINGILDKIIKCAKENNLIRILKEEYEECNIEKHIETMKGTISNLKGQGLVITDDEVNVVETFMRNTNTDYNSMFGISDGNHSDHFVGFKIKNNVRKEERTWGTIIIDAYESEVATFWEIICPNTKLKDDSMYNVGQEWLERMITFYMGLLSSSISKIVFEKEPLVRLFFFILTLLSSGNNGIIFPESVR